MSSPAPHLQWKVVPSLALKLAWYKAFKRFRRWPSRQFSSLPTASSGSALRETKCQTLEAARHGLVLPFASRSRVRRRRMRWLQRFGSPKREPLTGGARIFGPPMPRIQRKRPDRGFRSLRSAVVSNQPVGCMSGPIGVCEGAPAGCVPRRLVLPVVNTGGFARPAALDGRFAAASAASLASPSGGLPVPGEAAGEESGRSRRAVCTSVGPKSRWRSWRARSQLPACYAENAGRHLTQPFLTTPGWAWRTVV